MFISHSSADADWVETIAAQARALGVSPYLAQHDPRPGTDLSVKVRQAISGSDAVIVLLTAQGLNSPYVQQEIGVAIEQAKLVVPLVDPAVVGRSLGMLDGLEYIPFDFASPAKGTESLLAKLSELAGASANRQAASEMDDVVAGVLVAGAILLLIAVSIRQTR